MGALGSNARATHFVAGGVIAGHDFAPEKPWRFPGPVAAALQFAKEVKLEGRLLGLCLGDRFGDVFCSLARSD